MIYFSSAGDKDEYLVFRVVLLHGLGRVVGSSGGFLRNRLIIAFVVLAVVAAGGVGYFADRSSRASFSDTIGNDLAQVSNAQSIQVGQALKGQLDKLGTLALSRAVQERAAAGTLAAVSVVTGGKQRRVYTMASAGFTGA